MAATHKALMELIRGIHNIKPRHRGCVLTIGNFDGVHQGHHAVLARLQEKAAQLGLPACVMLFEPQPLELFAGAAAPARPSRWRRSTKPSRGCRSIDRMLCVRFTHRFAEQAASTFIEQLLVEKLGVHYLVVGDDFRFGKGGRGLPPAGRGGRRFGFEVISTQSFQLSRQRVSSTLVREALRPGAWRRWS